VDAETTDVPSSDGKAVTAGRGGGDAAIAIALVALVVAQLLWIALLVYGAYLARVWLPF
jgi:hypothetical protein